MNQPKHAEPALSTLTPVLWGRKLDERNNNFDHMLSSVIPFARAQKLSLGQGKFMAEASRTDGAGGSAELDSKVAVLEASIGSVKETVDDHKSRHDSHLSRLGQIDSKMEGLNSWVKVGGTVANGVITICLLGLSGLVWNLNSQISSIHSDVNVLKQSDRDRGIEIVRQIADPKTVPAFHEAVAAAVSNLEREEKDKKKPDPLKAETLADAIGKAAGRPDVSPDIWPLAADWISYRSLAKENFSPRALSSCSFVLSPATSPEKKKLNDQPHGPTLLASNCTLDLSDVRSVPTAFRQTATGTPAPNFRLSNVEVKYHDPSADSDVLQFDSLTCMACTYDFAAIDAPPDHLQKLMRKLVVADGRKLVFESASYPITK